MARRLPRALTHSFSRAIANGVTRRGHSGGPAGAAAASSRGWAAGSKSNDIPLQFPGARARRLPERNVRHRNSRPLQTA